MQPMLSIWGRASSANVMKVLWLIEELERPFERLDAGGAFGRTGEAAYGSMNPMRRVPTLVEADGFTLWESNTICRYLAGDHPTLHPPDPRMRARIHRWMDWQLAHLNPPMAALLIVLYRTPPELRDDAAVERARREAAAMWEIVAAALDDEPALDGAAPSLADIALGPFLHRWLHFPVERPDRPVLARWHARLMQRPGFAQHVAIPIS